MSQPVMDIEAKLREQGAIEERLRLPISESMFVRRSDMMKALFAERSEAADTIASLRSKLEEAEGARDRLAKKIAACNWYWPEDDTSSEACFESAQEVLDSAYISRGEVLAVARGGVVEVTYCASLPPADEADSDDEFWVEEKTYEAAVLKVADEQSRRTLASLREADHA